MPFRLRLLAPLCAAALAACGTPPISVETIKADRMVHLDQQFAPTRLNPEVSAKVPAAPAAAIAYERLVVSREGSAVYSGGKKEQWQSTLTVAPARDGYFKQVDQTLQGSTDRLFFTLSYQGLTVLRNQLVDLNAPMTPPIIEVKSAKRFDRFPAQPGQDWTTEVARGSEQVAAGLFQSLQVCKTGKTGAAQDLHPGIRGQAVELDCETSTNGGKPEHARMVYLSDYGVALQMGYASAELKSEYKITGFKVQ